MKTTKILVLTLACATLARAGLVEKTKSKPVLAGAVTFAPFSDISKKVTALGAMINNPIVPSLLIASYQQNLAKSHGQFRQDAPMAYLGYVQTPAWDVSTKNADDTPMEEMLAYAFVYPSAVGPAQMLLKHPGAKKEADGTIHLLPSKKHPDERYVKYAPDGSHCVFAPTAALAAQALADYARLAAARPKAEALPLVTAHIAERGITAFLAFQGQALAQQRAASPSNNVLAAKANAFNELQTRVQRRILGAYREATVTLDLDDYGISLKSTLTPKAGAAAFPAVKPLPPGVLDRALAPNAPFAACINARLANGLASEADFLEQRRLLGEILAAVPEVLLKKDKDLKPYAALIGEALAAARDYLPALSYPAADDWLGGSLACDAAQHPAILTCAQQTNAAQMEQASEKLLVRLAAALAKQWPGKALLARRPAGAWALDLARIIDLTVASSGVKPTDRDVAKNVAAAKANLTKLLGGTTLVAEGTRTGEKQVASRLAADGVKLPAAAKPTGEAELVALVPEAAQKRPSAVLVLRLYNATRDVALPMFIKMAKPKDVAQYKAILAGMPQGSDKGAIVGASWMDADGAAQGLLRITASEVKNYGAAFNAFTVASMASALDDDE